MPGTFSISTCPGKISPTSFASEPRRVASGSLATWRVSFDHPLCWLNGWHGAQPAIKRSVVWRDPKAFRTEVGVSSAISSSKKRDGRLLFSYVFLHGGIEIEPRDYLDARIEKASGQAPGTTKEIESSHVLITT